MKVASTACPHFLVLTLIILFPDQVIASSRFESVGMVASLNIQRYELDLAQNNTPIEARIDKVGLTLFEPSYNKIQAGIDIGYINMTQTNNPVTSGLSLTGNYLGIVMNSSLYTTQNIDFKLKASYTYHSVDKITTAQDTQINWHEIFISLGPSFKFGDLTVPLHVYYQFIDGDETTNGAITQTSNFEQDIESGLTVGFILGVDATGRVGVRGSVGGRKGIGFLFVREF